MDEKTSVPGSAVGPGPGRRGALLDIAVYIAAALVVYRIEMALADAGALPFASIAKGGLTLVVSFFVVAGIMKWRGQSWPALGLRRPPRWWTIPLWGFIVLVVNIAAQVTIVPVLGGLLGVPQPDLSRYEIIHGNLKIFLIAAPGAMLTGGFIEEFIYRGFMIDRLMRILGNRRRSPLYAALLCGVPFGLIHFEWGIGGILLTTVMGTVLGLMYLATKRNLWPLIAAHATMDLILMIQVYVQGTG